MTNKRDQSWLESLIANQIEESAKLDYKDPRSLGKSDSKKTELTKDVSAFANSDGGIIIYGITEHQEAGKRHLPEKIVPVKRKEFTKEWVEHIINNITPRIIGISIHSIDIDQNQDAVVYAIEIPASTTAHQARDKRYYKRFNFESVPMDDYEIRLAMNRVSKPNLQITQVSCHLSLTRQMMNTKPPYSSDTDFICAQFQINVENLTYLWANGHSCGLIGWSYGYQSEWNHFIEANFSIEEPELNKSYTPPPLNLTHFRDPSPNEIVEPFQSLRRNLGTVQIPYFVGKNRLPALWKGIIYVISRDTEPNIFQITLEIDQELHQISRLGNSIRNTVDGAFTFEEVVNRYPSISHSLVDKPEGI